MREVCEYRAYGTVIGEKEQKKNKRPNTIFRARYESKGKREMGVRILG